jgi:hypothetical protein
VFKRFRESAHFSRPAVEFRPLERQAKPPIIANLIPKARKGDVKIPKTPLGSREAEYEECLSLWPGILNLSDRTGEISPRISFSFAVRLDKRGLGVRCRNPHILLGIIPRSPHENPNAKRISRLRH